jgi:esterase
MLTSHLLTVIELFTRDFGDGSGPPMVVLHGLLGSSRNWLSAGNDLASHWSVSALDLRNHGKSPHADTMNYDTMVEDVLGWMDTRGIEQVDLMGHSMGGKVSMALACRYPHRVRQLIVVDIAPKFYFSNGHRAEFAAMHELSLIELKSRGEAELKMEGRVPDWGMRKFITTNLERTESGTWRWAINLPLIGASLPELEKNPLVPVDRFTGDTLFILGGKSRYVNDSDHDVIRRHFPAVKIETIAGSGHNPHMEARAEFVRTVVSHSVQGRP